MSPTALPPAANAAFTIVGIAATVSFLHNLFSFIHPYLQFSLLYRYAHPSPSGAGPWALVTGASDGIGREFANELAANGFNVVLHGRNQTKLSNVALKLEEDFPARSFRTLIADASSVQCTSCLSDASGDKETEPRVNFEVIKRQLSDLNLTVVINNAGGGLRDPTFAPLHEYSEERISGNISLNALFPLHLTRTLLPILIQNSPSLVMNISSMADQGFPLVAAYAASKSFLMTLTESVGLEMELAGHDVEVLGVRVGRTTGTSGLNARPSMFVPLARDLARAALGRVGCGRRIVDGYWAHSLQNLAASFLPALLLDKVKLDVMLKEKAGELAKKKAS
ncbi:putative oxidoreductase,short chain dehydrogenase [Dactylonectria macrodidyma]|uniref:Oxidoreductase,short chain dehydrogenase n=1 Tax=Dactylonectria macrodidyma TaxID=307937 RepID=A0A9P9J6U3_9HYPO|nr:putative oxidoreductase,short chain dehydrogenase [Dactylonectria macrodidyma]